jgi:fibronectin-binding autotransporter adhesin
LTFTGSAATRLGALEAATSSLYSYTSSLNNKTASFATTGSNTFIGTQTISGSVLQSGSFTTTGTIIAQTINVQTVTSSIIYSSGSNIFGNLLGDSQKFTGSVLITGSLTIAGASSATSYSGTTIYGSTAVCSAVGKFSTCIDAGSGTFSSSVTATGLVSSFTSNANSNNGLNIVNSGTVGYGGAVTFNVGSGGINYNSARIYSENEGTGGTFRIQTANTSQVLSDRLLISNTGLTTFTGQISMTNTNPGIFMNGSAVDQTSLISNANGPSTILKFKAGSFIWANSDDVERMRICSNGFANFACELTAKTLGTNDLLLNNLNYECANYVDGTRGSWLIQEGACDLFIINQVSCKKYKFNLTEIK